MPIQNIGSDVIKAYLGGVHARQQEIHEANLKQHESEVLAETKRQHLEALKQAKEEFNATHALHKALNDTAVAQKNAEIQANFAKTGLAPGPVTETPNSTTEQDFQSMNQGSRMGSNEMLPNAQTPSFTRTMTLPSGQQLSVPDPFTFHKQQADLQDISNQPKVNLAVKTAQGIEGVKQPGRMELLTTKMAEEMKQKTELYKQQKDLLDTRLQGTHDTAIQVANINAAARRYAADHQKASGSQIDPQELSDMATQVAVGASAKPTGANGIHVTSILSRNGLTEFTPKEREKLTNLTQLDKVFDKLTAFADENLSSSKLGAVGTGIMSHIPMSDLSNKLSQISIDAGPIARVYEGATGRYTMQQLELAKKAMTSPNVTKEQAIERVNTLKTEAKSKILDDLLGRFSPNQRQMILKANGLEHSALVSPSPEDNLVNSLVKKHKQ